jgi:hypothetical protein
MELDGQRAGVVLTAGLNMVANKNILIPDRN